MSDHHDMCHMTSSISILHFLLNNWSRLIACNLKANIHRGVISNTCAHKNHWKVAKYSNVKASTNLWKWRNKAVGMQIAGCSNNLMSIPWLSINFWVASWWQGKSTLVDVNWKQRFAKTAVLLQRRGATASYLHAKLPMSYIWRLEWGELTRV